MTSNQMPPSKLQRIVIHVSHPLNKGGKCKSKIAFLIELFKWNEGHQQQQQQ